MNELKDIVFNLKGEYFDEIKAGIKKFEYRLKNDYWSKRLVNRQYKNVIFKKGYPKNSDTDKILVMPYRGYVVQTITHKHFGTEPVEVFAIMAYPKHKIKYYKV
jgi:ASC-1-like (ASCH) protein